MAIIECEHVAGGSQATIACGTCARAEGFAAGRLAAVQDALKLCRAMTELLDELPMTAKLWGPHDVAYKLEQQIAALAQHATAVASEPRSEADDRRCGTCGGSGYWVTGPCPECSNPATAIARALGLSKSRSEAAECATCRGLADGSTSYCDVHHCGVAANTGVHGKPGAR